MYYQCLKTAKLK